MNLRSESAFEFSFLERMVSFKTIYIVLFESRIAFTCVTLVLLLTLWLIVSSVCPSEESFHLPSPLPFPAKFPQDAPNFLHYPFAFPLEMN